MFTFITDVLKFDNSYSWARQKEVLYNAQVFPPDTDFTLPPTGTVDTTSVSASSTHSDEFFDCAQDLIDRISQASQSSLTAVAEVNEVAPVANEQGGTGSTNPATGAGHVILQSSVSTTV